MGGIGAGMGRALGGLAAAAALFVPDAAAQTYTPVDTPGPALSVSQTQLDAALDCSGDLSAAAREPVLLVPGTTLTPEKNYDWNWIPALEDLGWEYCTVELPGSAMADVQVAGEYVVNAIRTMYSDYGEKIDVQGFSQGGMVPRWALRFWPDTRPMVDDVVGIAASNHGTTHPGAIFQCGSASGCAPAIWQQLSTSAFIAALNSHQETFSGIDYTAIYTRTDDVVQPNSDDTGSSSLRPGDGPSITNVAIQDICTNPSIPYQTHSLVGTVSNPAYLLAIEALDNAGPADPSQVDVSGAACTNPMPGVDPMTGNQDYQDTVNYSNNQMNTYPKVQAEPYVACYAVTPCGPPPATGGGALIPPSATQQPTGSRAAALKKCKKKRGRARASCKRKAKKLPV